MEINDTAAPEKQKQQKGKRKQGQNPAQQKTLPAPIPVLATHPKDSNIVAIAYGPELNIVDASKGEIVLSDTAKSVLSCVEFNYDGTKLATGGQDKVVRIYEHTTEKAWALVAQRECKKKISALAFPHTASDVVLAGDYNGDAHKIEYLKQQQSDDQEEETASNRPLLGHLAIISNVAITEDDKYFLTADRDAKIRVSHYPDTYDIEMFCLGHTELVTSMHLLRGMPAPLLVSGAADNTLRAWNYITGKLLLTHTFTEITGDSSVLSIDSLNLTTTSNNNSEPRQVLLSVVTEKSKQVLFFLLTVSPDGSAVQLIQLTPSGSVTSPLSSEILYAAFAGGVNSENVLWVLTAQKPNLHALKLTYDSSSNSLKIDSYLPSSMHDTINNKLSLKEFDIEYPSSMKKKNKFDSEEQRRKQTAAAAAASSDATTQLEAQDDRPTKKSRSDDTAADEE
eukprot:GEZU01023503.1.p1 GENE.GEZU01023503.1~~GEZU01023503.1.p1  ORF type:complete len:486 (+),score=140.78 GEZU01023503.1:105-1460(+)